VAKKGCMFGLFKSGRENVERQAIIARFLETCTVIHKANLEDRLAVAIGIGMANAMFLKKYGSRHNFAGRPSAERVDYVKQFGVVEQTIFDKQDTHIGIAFGLFKTWIGGIAFEDPALENLAAEHIEKISRYGPSASM
jgi:hypothetical protein